MRESTLFIFWISLLFTCNSFGQTETKGSDVSDKDGLGYSTVSFENAIEKAKLYGESYPDSGLVWLKYAHDLAEKKGDIDQEIESLIQISQFQFWNSSFSKASTSAQEADSLLQIHPNDLSHLSVLYLLAETYEFTGSPKKAKQNYLSCYDLAEQLENSIMLSRLDIKMGNLIMVNDRDSPEALDYFKKAIARFPNKSQAYKVPYLKAQLEYYDLMLRQKNLSALKDIGGICSEISLALSEIREDDALRNFEVPFSDLEIRCIVDIKKSLESVEYDFPKIATLRQQTTNENKLQTRLDLYTKLAIKQEDYHQAKVYSDTSWSMAHNSKNFVLKLQSIDLRQKIFKHFKDYSKVTEYMVIGDSIRHLLLEDRRVKSIGALERQMLKKENEWKTALFEKDKAMLAKRNTYFLISSIGFGILSFLAVYFFNLSRKRNQIISDQNQAIAKQNQELEQLNLAKDHIFAVVAHDLRKPAIAFRGITKKVNHLLKKEDYATLNLLGNEIEKDARALNQLTDNLLNWALLKKDILPNRPQLIALETITGSLKEVFANVLQQKNIGLDINCPAELKIFADPDALHIILRNLVDNAIKFTHPGGIILFTVQSNTSTTVIQIQDNGVGIPEALMPTLFSLKKGKSTAGTNGEKGTGLGLHLVKELVELNKGTIAVESQLDKGTTFTITLLTKVNSTT